MYGVWWYDILFVLTIMVVIIYLWWYYWYFLGVLGCMWWIFVDYFCVMFELLIKWICGINKQCIVLNMIGDILLMYACLINWCKWWCWYNFLLYEI